MEPSGYMHFHSVPFKDFREEGVELFLQERTANTRIRLVKIQKVIFQKVFDIIILKINSAKDYLFPNSGETEKFDNIPKL